MTHQDPLYSLSARAYFDRAVRLAIARQWDEAALDLKRCSALQPLDYHAFLLWAKIYLYQGRPQQALIALDRARQLGHDAATNERMVAFIRNKDRKRQARKVFRERTRLRCVAAAKAVGGGVAWVASRVGDGFAYVRNRLISLRKKRDPDQSTQVENVSAAPDTGQEMSVNTKAELEPTAAIEGSPLPTGVAPESAPPPAVSAMLTPNSIETPLDSSSDKKSENDEKPA